MPPVIEERMERNAANKKALQRSIRAVAKPWIDAYSSLPDRDFMVRSLLKGIEHRLAQKRGELTEAQRIQDAFDYDRGAFYQGRRCAEQIPESSYSLRPALRSTAA